MRRYEAAGLPGAALDFSAGSTKFSADGNQVVDIGVDCSLDQCLLALERFLLHSIKMVTSDLLELVEAQYAEELSAGGD